MPHCAHFGLCGGCAVDVRRGIDKPALLARALTRAGWAEPMLAPLVEPPLGTRRRADLAASRNGAGIALGLHQAGSPEVVDMRECALLLPDIVQLLPELRALLRGLQGLRRRGDVVINWLNDGPDITLGLDGTATGSDRSRIIEFARRHGVVRMSTRCGAQLPEPVVILAPPVISFSGAAVEPPPGAFLQASAQGEAAIIKAMLAGLPKLTRKSFIVELFAGVGTLSFALAGCARVVAHEGDAAAFAAHDRAIRRNNLAGRMTVSMRDLHRRPLAPVELSKAACVVLDPPFAGAGLQMRALAASGVPRVVYVSCNPEALARDAAQLHRAGYALLGATPIDQFPYSANVESVVVLGRVSDRTL